MEIELIEDPEKELIDFLDKKIDEFNWRNWEVKERKRIAVKLQNENAEVTAGAAGRTFGDWLLLDTLWVSEKMRGQDLGSKLLAKIEMAAKERGCKKSLLDTSNFQAMPFYKKHGYEIQWTLESYPKTSSVYYMVKELR